MPGGDSNSRPTPKAFRGCSTAEDGKSRALDFSFALEYAPVFARLRLKGLLLSDDLKLIANAPRCCRVSAQMLCKSNVAING